jgi:hypothetical protein
MPTNLPIAAVSDSAEATKLFFNQYGIGDYEFSANEVSATLAFFTNKGFGKDASNTVSAAILRQSRIENVPVFKLLDLIKDFTPVQLNSVIANILNNDRKPTSTLGFKTAEISKLEIQRNIAA